MTIETMPFNVTTGYPSTDNFPALKHWWCFDDVSSLSNGVHQLTDRIGGVILNITKGPFGFESDNNNCLSSGVLTDPNSKHLLLVAQLGYINADANTQAIVYGATDPSTSTTVNLGLSFRHDYESYATIDGSNYATITNSATAEASGYSAALTGTAIAYADFKNVDALNRGAGAWRATADLATPDYVAGSVTGSLYNSNDFEQKIVLSTRATTTEADRYTNLFVLVGDNGMGIAEQIAAIRWMEQFPGYLYPGFSGF